MEISVKVALFSLNFNCYFLHFVSIVNPVIKRLKELLPIPLHLDKKRKKGFLGSSKMQVVKIHVIKYSTDFLIHHLILVASFLEQKFNY